MKIFIIIDERKTHRCLCPFHHLNDILLIFCINVILESWIQLKSLLQLKFQLSTLRGKPQWASFSMTVSAWTLSGRLSHRGWRRERALALLLVWFLTVDSWRLKLETSVEIKVSIERIFSIEFNFQVWHYWGLQGDRSREPFIYWCIISESKRE